MMFEPYTSLPWYRWSPQLARLEQAMRGIRSMEIHWDEVREHRGSTLVDLSGYSHGIDLSAIRTEHWSNLT